jgi:hypothetical protein
MQRKENTSQFRGVYWVKRDKRWRSKISAHGVTIVLGNFTDELEAARAYNTAAIRHHGPQFAVLNIVDEEEQQ